MQDCTVRNSKIMDAIKAGFHTVNDVALIVGSHPESMRHSLKNLTVKGLLRRDKTVTEKGQKQDCFYIAAPEEQGTTFEDVVKASEECEKTNWNTNGTASFGYPKPETRTYWICSDGNEFTREVDALRRELNLERGKKR